MKLVLTRRLPGRFTADLIDFYDEVAVLEEDRPLSSDELGKALDGADVAIVQLTDKITVDTFSSSLKCIITYSVGIEHIDAEVLRRNHCLLSHTPGVLTDATADLTWALILACARRVVPASRWVHQGKFNGFGPELFMGNSLFGKTLGIVGMGRIGTAVAQRALGFGMKIQYCNRKRIDEELEALLNTRLVDFKTLLTESDVISFHCSLNDESKGMMGPEEFRVLKEDAVLVNTARGALWDEQALVKYLTSHPLASAGLDVYVNEPLVPKELLSLNNAVLLPHIGSADRHTREQMARICVEEAIRFVSGHPLRYGVNL